jgi:hypothetical protein
MNKIKNNKNKFKKTEWRQTPADQALFLWELTNCALMIMALIIADSSKWNSNGIHCVACPSIITINSSSCTI